jgi:hypothetical protein
MHLLPPLFFYVKTIKTCFDNKETETKPRMCGKIKPVLKERSSELLRQKSSRLACFFCHLQIIPTKVSQDNT